MVSIKGKFELEDFVAAKNLYQYPETSAIWVIAGVGILLVSPLLWLIVFPGTDTIYWPVIYFVLVFISFYLFTRYAWSPKRSRRANVQNTNNPDDFEMTFNDESYNSVTAYGTTHMPWKDFIKWKADNRIILLFRTNDMFQRIPRRYFNNETDVQYVLQRLQKNNVKAAKLVNPSTARIIRILIWAYLGLGIAVMIYLNLR